MKKCLLLVLILWFGAVPVIVFAKTSDKQAKKESNVLTTEKIKSSQDLRALSQTFMEKVNDARIALATGSTKKAQENILQAQELLALIREHSASKRRIESVESGRLSYDKDKESYYYFPLEIGPIEVKTTDTGPFWAKKKGIAVTDASIVQLSLDLTDDRAETFLTQAEIALKKGKIQEAQDYLTDLNAEVIYIDEKEALPLEKARDNISLTRTFIKAGNYDAARYALKHADDGLDSMEKDDRYKDKHSFLITMRKEMSSLQRSIEKSNPTLMDKADSIMEKWWWELNGWEQEPTQKH